MKRTITMVLGVCAALVCAACVTSSAGSDNPAVFNVNGRDIYAADLIKSPMVRQAIKQYLITDALMRAAGKAGLYADEKDIDDQIQNIEQDALRQNMTIDDYLMKKQGITVDEVRESIKSQQLFEKLVDSQAKVTDKELDDYWNEHADEVKYSYARDNHLTEAERAKLTRDDVKDSLENMVRQDKLGQTRKDTYQSLIDGINLKILVMPDKAEEKMYEDLMINNSKTQPEEAQAGEGQAPEGQPEGGAPGTEQPPSAGAAGTSSSIQQGPGPKGGGESTESSGGEQTPPDESAGNGDKSGGDEGGSTEGNDNAGGDDTAGSGDTGSKDDSGE